MSAIAFLAGLGAGYMDRKDKNQEQDIRNAKELRDRHRHVRLTQRHRRHGDDGQQYRRKDREEQIARSGGALWRSSCVL